MEPAEHMQTIQHPAAAPRVPPRSAATLVLLRAAAGSMELLLMRRAESDSPYSGAFVFPGGALEASDLEPRVLARVTGLGAAAANATLGLSADALGHWVAVVRECFEESGILLAVDEQQRPLDPERQALLAPGRSALNAGEISFADFLDRERLLIPADRIVYVDRWITPALLPRRFDTRFFVAEAPEGQRVQHDNAELVESHWLTPATALERSRQNQINLLLPTRTIISSLAGFTHPAEALSHARSARAPENRPCVAQGKDGQKVFHRTDWAYAEIHWVDREEAGTSTYDLRPDQPKMLDRHVTRLLAPNANAMTGPGTNGYLVGEEELAVIDPGPDDPAHIRALLEAGRGRIRWILLTHTHTDHAPAALALREATGARIAGRPPRAQAPHNVSIDFDRVLADGELLQVGDSRLRVVHTPGHASNHLCYLLENTGMLFSGDHLVQGFTVVIAPPDGNMGAYLQSLERLAAMDIAILAPGHGYLIGQPAREIARLIAHRRGREEKVRRALAAVGPAATLATLLPVVYDDVAPALYPMAMLSLQAHLDKLVEDGELAVEGPRWIRRSV